MKSLTVKSGLMTVLSRLEGREFTVDDLTETYMKDQLSLHQSKKAARQFVYRNMLRLISAGDMTRVVVAAGWPLYRLTSQFFKRVPPAEAPLVVAQEVVPSSPPKEDSRQTLHERLRRHKLEMLSAMGETEEYDAICAEMPDMRDEIQPLYNESRDKCSKLLGRVKALESLLARETGSP